MVQQAIQQAFLDHVNQANWGINQQGVLQEPGFVLPTIDTDLPLPNPNIPIHPAALTPQVIHNQFHPPVNNIPAQQPKQHPHNILVQQPGQQVHYLNNLPGGGNDNPDQDVIMKEEPGPFGNQNMFIDTSSEESATPEEALIEEESTDTQ